MGRIIGAAVIGCGVIGPTHAQALELDGRVKLLWSCDINEKKAPRVPAPNFTTDYRKVLEDKNVDLICVCTQHPPHTQVVLGALAAGKHVVCEKPLASTPEDLAKLLKAARDYPKQVTSGIFQHRFTPFARRFKELMADGQFGEIYSASLDFHCTRTDEYYAADAWRGKWVAEGGGVFINQAIHTLDLFQWWLGGDPVEVSGKVARRRMKTIEVEDSGEGRIRFASGRSGRVRAVNDGIADWSVDLVIEGEHGSARIGAGHMPVEITHKNLTVAAELMALGKVKLEGIKMPGKAVYGNQHAMQMADVVGAIIEGRKPKVTFEDAAAANAVVLGLYHSTATGAPAALPVENYQTPTLPLL